MSEQFREGLQRWVSLQKKEKEQSPVVSNRIKSGTILPNGMQVDVVTRINGKLVIQSKEFSPKN